MVYLKRQLHVLLPVVIKGLWLRIMHFQKCKKGGFWVFGFMLNKMLHQQRHLQQLIRFSSRCQVQAKQYYGKTTTHLFKNTPSAGNGGRNI